MDSLRWYFMGIGSVLAVIGITAGVVQWLSPRITRYDRGHK